MTISRRVDMQLDRSSQAMRAPAADSARSKIRIFVVDDSATVRGFFARWFSECDDLECVGSAANGLEAIAAIPAARPDIVILDIEMPHMNGLEALPLIRVSAPRAAIIIASRLTRKNAELALRCLQGGATDVLPKPQTGDDGVSLEDFRRDVLQKARALAGHGAQPSHALSPLPEQPAPLSPINGPRSTMARTHSATAPARVQAPAPTIQPRAIVVGASTGGPHACAQLIAAMKPLIARLPVVIAQHMPPVFTRVFAEHLTATTGAPCREARDGELLSPRQVYIGPGGHHVTIGGSSTTPTLRVDNRPPVHFSRPSVDLLFLSARDIFGAQAIGVMLTGMGSDGLEGARAMAESGARIYAQDEASSVVWGMPGAVARAGLTFDVLAPPEIGAALQKAFGR